MNTSFIAQFTNNWFKSPQINPAELPVMATVVGLDKFDLRHVYHHLSSGVALQLRYNHSAKTAQEAVEVCYQQFKIGELSVEKAEVVANMLLHGFDLKVTLTQTEKVKYMPHHYLEIAITDNVLF
jgi:hypothetical protein